MAPCALFQKQCCGAGRLFEMSPATVTVARFQNNEEHYPQRPLSNLAYSGAVEVNKVHSTPEIMAFNCRSIEIAATNQCAPLFSETPCDVPNTCTVAGNHDMRQWAPYDLSLATISLSRTIRFGFNGFIGVGNQKRFGGRKCRPCHSTGEPSGRRKRCWAYGHTSRKLAYGAKVSISYRL